MGLALRLVSVSLLPISVRSAQPVFCAPLSKSNRGQPDWRRGIDPNLLRCTTFADFHKYAKQNGAELWKGAKHWRVRGKDGAPYTLGGSSDVASKRRLPNGAIKAIALKFVEMGISPRV